MAIDGYAVNGGCIISTGTGTLGALETLGYTDQGVDIEIRELVNPIVTDVSGMSEQDVQTMGLEARIVVNLIAMDRTVLAKITGRGDRTAVGQTNTPGVCLGASGYLFRVGLSAPADTPWSFSTCYTNTGFSTRLASKLNPFRIEFKVIPYKAVTATTGKDGTLWTRSLA